MNSMLQSELDRIVNKQFEQNRAVIDEALLSGLQESDSKDRIYVKMLHNSMVASADVAVKLVLEILFSLNVLAEVDEKKIRKTLLSVVKEEV